MTFGEKRFNKKLDKIRRLEESGVLAKKKKKSRVRFALAISGMLTGSSIPKPSAA